MQVKNETSPIDIIPIEIYPLFLMHLEPKDLVFMMWVNRNWNKAAFEALGVVITNKQRELQTEFESVEENNKALHLVNNASEFNFLPLLWSKESSPFNNNLASIIFISVKQRMFMSTWVQNNNIVKKLSDLEPIRRNLQRADFSDYEIGELPLNGSCFNYANFKNAKFKGTALSVASFKKANLEDVTMDSETNIIGASFEGANLQNISLSNVQFYNGPLPCKFMTVFYVHENQLEAAESLLGITMTFYQKDSKLDVKKLKERVVSDYFKALDSILTAEKTPVEKIETITEMLFRLLKNKDNLINYQQGSDSGKTNSHKIIMNKGIGILLQIFKDNPKKLLIKQETVENIKEIALSAAPVISFFSSSPASELLTLFDRAASQAKFGHG